MTLPISRKVQVIRNAFLGELLADLERKNNSEDWHSRNPTIWIEFEGFPGIMFKAIVELDPKKED